MLSLAPYFGSQRCDTIASHAALASGAQTGILGDPGTNTSKRKANKDVT